MTVLRRYASKQVSCTVENVGQVTGFTDGSFITFEPAEDISERVVGADGEVTASYSPDLGGTVTLTLKNTSPWNALFTEWAYADHRTQGQIASVINSLTLGGAAGMIFTIFDNITKEKLICNGVWPAAYPSTDYTKEAPDREWKFHVAEVIRSNAQFADNVAEIIINNSNINL